MDTAHNRENATYSQHGATHWPTLRIVIQNT